MLTAHGADLPYVFHRERLASAGIVGHGEHHHWIFVAPDARNQRLRRGDQQMTKCWLLCSPSGITSPTASASTSSTLARVVSKCVMSGPTSPLFYITLKSMSSAARSLCVGLT